MPHNGHFTQMFEGNACGVSVSRCLSRAAEVVVGIIGKHVYLMLYVVLVCTLCIVLSTGVTV